MIQIYKAGNTNYEVNGDKVIFPTSCEVDMQLNKDWELTLVHPIDGNRDFELVSEGNVICAPTPMGKRQLFRIYDKTKTRTEVTAYARPIFWDSAKDVFLLDVRPTEKNGQSALDILVKETKYKAESDIGIVNTAYYVNRNLMESLQGVEDN